MNLQTPEKVRKLQTALHAKAKGSPNYRFYALYDKVYREDVLAFAYRCCQANGGAAGVDDQIFEDIESYGLERWLGELAEGLPGDRRACPASATSMVASKVRDAGRGTVTLSRSLFVRDIRSCPAERSYAQLPVGESMNPCPRAVCGKSARTVR